MALCLVVAAADRLCSDRARVWTAVRFSMPRPFAIDRIALLNMEGRSVRALLPFIELRVRFAIRVVRAAALAVVCATRLPTLPAVEALRAATGCVADVPAAVAGETL